MPPTRGGNRRGQGGCGGCPGFNTCPPRGGATCSRPVSYHTGGGFNTCPPRGGATKQMFGLLVIPDVSIHAPHAGGQPQMPTLMPAARTFQYMPPTRGGNLMCVQEAANAEQFQYMPPTRGGNSCSASMSTSYLRVSIHAPHAGGQPVRPKSQENAIMFQYMPPTRGGNSSNRAFQKSFVVSIHAPHAGGQLA